MSNNQLPVEQVELDLPKGQQITIMRAVNDAAAKGKAVLVGKHYVFGAMFYKDELYFLIPGEFQLDYIIFGALPKMRAHRMNTSAIIRAISPNKIGEEIIFDPTTVPRKEGNVWCGGFSSNVKDYQGTD